MTDVTQEFYELIACIGMNYSNFDAALYVEKVLKTDSRLQQAFYANRFGTFSKHTFIAKGIAESLLVPLFYPVPNATYIEQIMQLHRHDDLLLQFLAEQYHAQQIWHSYFEHLFYQRHVLTLGHIRELRNTMPKDFLRKCDRVKLSTPHFFVPHISDASIAARVSSAFQYLSAADIVIDNVPKSPDSFFISIINQFRETMTADKQSSMTTTGLRKVVQEYAEKNFKTFVSVVQMWTDMYQYASEYDRQWEFFDNYKSLPNAIQRAKKLLSDHVIEDKTIFYPDLFTIDVIVDHISNIFQRALMLVLLDLNTESSYSIGFLQDPNGAQWVSFIVKDGIYFYSMTIQKQRYFPKNRVPPNNLPFLNA